MAGARDPTKAILISGRVGKVKSGGQYGHPRSKKGGRKRRWGGDDAEKTGKKTTESKTGDT